MAVDAVLACLRARPIEIWRLTQQAVHLPSSIEFWFSKVREAIARPMRAALPIPAARAGFFRSYCAAAASAMERFLFMKSCATEVLEVYESWGGTGFIVREEPHKIQYP